MMSSVVTSILSSAVCLLWNKARDAAAEKLKDGDITDAKLREILLRELNDVSFKLDGLSRKDLLSSYRFLKEGVHFLNESLVKEDHGARQDVRDTTSSRVGARLLSETTLGLPYAMQQLKINSDKDFESAKERFKYARIRATEAFCNESLSITDRIFAAKLRVVSEILECLESPETAITGCLSFLQELHSLPAVCEIFSVYLGGGIRSMFSRVEREENVASVMLINYVVFQLNLKFSRKFTNRLTWPGPAIQLVHRMFNPIEHWDEVLRRILWGEWGVQSIRPTKQRLILRKAIDPYRAVVNGDSETVVWFDGEIRFISRSTDEIKDSVVNLPDPGECRILGNDIAGLVCDHKNNLYVVRWLHTSTGNGVLKRFVFYVLDEKYNVKHHCTLEFLDSKYFIPIKIALNNNGIIMTKYNDRHVYVCDRIGQLKYKFEQDSHSLRNLAISKKNEILIPSDNGEIVYILNEQGDLKFTISLPEGHKIRAVAFYHVLCKIIVLTYNWEKLSNFLLCFSETGELENSTLFSNSGDRPISMVPHPNGAVVVISNRKIVFIL